MEVVVNTHTDENNFTHIDYYDNHTDECEGKTVAIICRDTSKVFYLDNGFKYSSGVTASINKVLEDIKNGKPKICQPLYNLGELREVTKDYLDTDTVKIEVFDTVANEDLYSFYVDPIHMGEDSKTKKDRGHELRLTLIPNKTE